MSHSPREAVTQAIKEAGKEVIWLKREQERSAQRIYSAHARGVSWKAEQLQKSEPPYSQRLQELNDFIFFLNNQYWQKVEQSLFDGMCTCGLYVTSHEVCMECGKDVCTLHSQPYYETTGRKRELLGRICDDCQETE